ncbi:MAG: hypothetical protein ACM3N5_14210 [Candidatus Eiseniibacteriota bacterium]
MIAPLFLRRACVLAGLAVAAAGPSAAALAEAGGAAPAAFIERLGDVPLMPGLRIVDGDGVDFDAPGGRIVEVAATGAVPRAAVLSFYQRSLPPLGWTGGGRIFQRDGEKLRLELAGAGARTEIRFFLSPTN